MLESSEKNRIRGYKSNLKGLNFERKVANLWAQKGYRIKQRKRTTKQELDLVCDIDLKWGRNEIVLIECKNKTKVTIKDFIKFCKNFRKFITRNEQNYNYVKGVFYYTGKLDKDIRFIKEILPEEEKEKMTIMKIKP